MGETDFALTTANRGATSTTRLATLSHHAPSSVVPVAIALPRNSSVAGARFSKRQGARDSQLHRMAGSKICGATDTSRRGARQFLPEGQFATQILDFGVAIATSAEMVTLLFTSAVTALCQKSVCVCERNGTKSVSN